MRADPRASSKRRVHSRGGHSSLDAYFDALGKHSLLTPEREIEMASTIEDIELAQWSTVFEVEAGRRSIRAALERAHGEPLDSVEPAALRAIDPDRVLADAAVIEVDRVADGARLGPGIASWRTRVHGLARAATRARKRFAEANLRLVVKVAREYDYGRLPLPDLIQEGNVGLLQAIGRFDASRGTRFATYGVWWIRHAVRRALVNKGRSVRVPNHVAGAGYRVLSATEEMTQRLGRPPNLDEIAAACDMEPARVERVQMAMMQTDVSLDAPQPGGDGSRTLADVLPMVDEADMTLDDMLASQRALEQVLHMMPNLTDIEADVLRRRFGLLGAERQTLVQIGSHHGLSRERIRQLQRQAIDKLRRGLRRSGML